MEYTVKSPLLSTQATQRTQKNHKLLFLLIFPAFVAGIFFGYMSGIRDAEQKVFTAGYDAAMHHVSATIKEKSGEMDSFYMSDLGIKFIPRGNNILGIKYVGKTSGPTDKMHVAEAKR
jgi:hypothetical protein